MIGIFDSTIGGLAIARAVEHILPQYSLVYLGDTAGAQYGHKKKAALVQYAIESTKFLIERGAKIVVIGCDSAASAAAERVQQTFDIPVFEIITPVIQKVISLDDNRRIGIIGTHTTINSSIYSNAIISSKPECKFFPKPCPLLTPLIEEGWAAKKETKMILRRYLHSLKIQQLDTLILGCAHYALLKQLIQHRIGKKVVLIDPSIEVIKYIKSYLQRMPDMLASEKTSPVKHLYFVTAITETTGQVAAQILKRPIQLQLI